MFSSHTQSARNVSASAAREGIPICTLIYFTVGAVAIMAEEDVDSDGKALDIKSFLTMSMCHVLLQKRFPSGRGLRH